MNTTLTHPPEFRSNAQYLEWEMEHLRRRLWGYLDAQDDPSQRDAYAKLQARLRAERRLIVHTRRLAVARGVAIPFDALAERLGLTGEEEELLMVCMAPHLSFAVWGLLIEAQGSASKSSVEVGFLSALLAQPGQLVSRRDWCRPGARLIERGLLYTEPPRGGSAKASVLGRAVHAPHYVVLSITEGAQLDELLAPYCDITTPERELFDVILTPEAQGHVQSLVRGFYHRKQLLELRRSWTVLISGPRLSGKTSVIEGLVRALKRPMFSVHLERLPRGPRAVELLELAERNARFVGAVLVLHQPEQVTGAEPELRGLLKRILRTYPGMTVLEPHRADHLAPSLEPLIQFAIDLGRPNSATRNLLWETLMPHDVAVADDVNLPHLASTYDLTGGQIEAAITWGRQCAASRGAEARIRQRDLVEGAKSQLRSKLDGLTDASKAELSFDQLVLPERAMGQVQELLDACRCRQFVMNEWGFGRRLATGRGLVALFTGPPGTGKTLTAEILAHSLGLRLHIVSIPKVVSKWVGETEKNIRQIFSQARAQNSMLLFDEADSLFASRVKVERAQDRFQNMEVNNLLQEIERFEGVVILTTNLETNMDDAFQRRILFKIEFPKPEVEQREAIWRSLIPAQTPIRGRVDFRLLAETFELTGGQIKNAIVRAAYRSYAAGHGLNQRQLEVSAQQQASAAGHLAPMLAEVRSFG